MSAPAACRMECMESQPQASIARPRIVLVDDEPAILEIWGRILTLSGYDAACFSNPILALNAIASGCDCVITDYHMPEMNGVELIRVARPSTEAHFLLMTANPSDGVRDEAMSAGAAFVVHKPTTAPIVLQKLAALCRRG